MITGLQHPRYDEIERIRRVIGEAESIRIRSVEELSQELASFVDKFSCLHAEIVPRSPRIHAEVAVEMIHIIIDFFRLWIRRCSVVEIDDILQELPPVSGNAANARSEAGNISSAHTKRNYWPHVHYTL